MQEYAGTINELRFLTQNILEVEILLTSPGDIVFKAGQFMNFVFPGGVRSYSLVSVPDHNSNIKFCVELLEHGVGSDFFRRAHVGDAVTMRGPQGIFTIDDTSKNLFFVAVGVGIAPFASMIPDVLGKGFVGAAHLLFCVRHEEDVFYFDRFNHLQHIYPNFKFTPILSQPKSHWPGEVGRVTSYLDVAYEYYRDNLFYVCGGSEMVRETKDLLVKKGHASPEVRLEIFA